MINLQVKLKAIQNLINNIYIKYEKEVYNNSTINNIGYVISYLDEIEKSINTHFFGLCILDNMLENNVLFYNHPQISNLKIDFFTIKYILDFNQKRIYTMFKNLKLIERIEYPTEFVCNNDNHDISNRINFFKDNKRNANIEDLSHLYTIVYKDIYNISTYVILTLKKLEIKDKDELIEIFKTKIKEIKKFNLNNVLENSHITSNPKLKMDRNLLNDKLKNYINILGNSKHSEKFLLIYDCIFRVFEANHLLNVSYKIKNDGSNKIFFNDILVNTAINLVCSSYDKISKELSGKSYFSTLEKNKINKPYMSYNFIKSNIKNFDNIVVMAKEPFKIKNTLLHSCTPGNLLNKNERYIYIKYKEYLVHTHSIILADILEFIINVNNN